MATLQRIQESLDLLERFLPGAGTTSPDSESFWISFTLRADLIREGAGSHSDYVRERLEQIVSGAGMSHGTLTAG